MTAATELSTPPLIATRTLPFLLILTGLSPLLISPGALFKNLSTKIKFYLPFLPPDGQLPVKIVLPKLYANNSILTEVFSLINSEIDNSQLSIFLLIIICYLVLN